MDIKEQEKISKLIREQAHKLGIALKALRDIKRLDNTWDSVDEATIIAGLAIVEISNYGKRPEDL